MDCVDLFAGWGGFTEGATKSEVRVLYAANHWPLAVAEGRLECVS
jgi:DNA (cytosine-5)-methyltransferase 1